MTEAVSAGRAENVREQPGRMLLAAPQGFEPRYADPESAVLPLNEGAVRKERIAVDEKPETQRRAALLATL